MDGKWRIRHKTFRGKRQYWSEEYGWTWRETADVFTDEQHESMVLPRYGVWEAVVE